MEKKAKQINLGMIEQEVVRRQISEDVKFTHV